MSMDHGLTVVDLFCGGGGFSEGFRQAGFDILHAVDYEQRAVDTHELNMRPGESTKVECKNVLELEPSDLPEDVDVLIGSPPCTEFSSAKRGGNGDIEEGMKLVARFLYFVAELQPRYWLMENVPRMGTVDQFDDWVQAGAVPYRDIPWLEGEGKIELNKKVYDADDFGTPQRRSRLFSGNIPFPESPDKVAPTFGEICNDTFPDPLAEPSDDLVEDPVYPNLRLPAEELTDHYYNSHLTAREAKEIRVLKEDHSFYGPMSFPDDPDVPSRTVLAMNRRIARETLVCESEQAPDGFSKYRKPTIREIASIQGFPITYQFTGSSLAQKWRRVGDAVPSTISFALAREILDIDGHEVNDLAPDVRQDAPEVETDLKDKDMSTKGRRKLSLSRSFRHHVPYDDMREFRVDLETEGEPAIHPLSRWSNEGESTEHPVRFKVYLYKGYAKSVQKTEMPLSETLDLVEGLLEQHSDLTQKMANFFSDVDRSLSNTVPDATTLQAIRSRRLMRDDPLEYEILEMISAKPEDNRTGIVDRWFPYDEFSDVVIESDGLFDGTNLPIRVLMKALAANYVAHKLNHCSKWLVEAEKSEIYFPDDIQLPEGWRESLRCHPSTSTDNVCIEDFFQAQSRRIIDSKKLADPIGLMD